MKYFAYARTSADDGQKVSVEAQLQQLKHHLTDGAVEVFYDKGISGSTDERTGFQKLKQTIQNNHFPAKLVVWRYDRIARNVRIMLEFIGFCKEHQVEVYSLSEPLPLGQSSEATEKLMIQALAIIGELERNVIIENINSTLKWKKSQQHYLASQVPIGYLLINGKVIQDHFASTMIKRMYELYVTGEFGYHNLMRKLIQEGYEEFVPKTPQGIAKILGNPIYYGWIRGGKLGGFYGTFTPLISKELFDRVQEIRKSRKKTKRMTRSFPLQKKIHCPHCQRRLSVSIIQNQKEYAYYHCSNRACEGIFLNAEKFENQVFECIRTFLFRSDYYKKVAHVIESKNRQKQKENARQISDTRQTKEELLMLYEQGNITKDEFTTKFSEIPSVKEVKQDYKNQFSVYEEKLDELMEFPTQELKELFWQQVTEIQINNQKESKVIYLQHLSKNILEEQVKLNV